MARQTDKRTDGQMFVPLQYKIDTFQFFFFVNFGQMFEEVIKLIIHWNQNSNVFFLDRHVCVCFSRKHLSKLWFYVYDFVFLGYRSEQSKASLETYVLFLLPKSSIFRGDSINIIMICCFSFKYIFLFDNVFGLIYGLFKLNFFYTVQLISVINCFLKLKHLQNNI